MNAGGDLLLQIYGALDPMTKFVVVSVVVGLLLPPAFIIVNAIFGGLARSGR